MRQKSTGLILCDLHGQNRLQSVMTETLADNGGTEVVDQFLIDISTGDFSDLDSQTSARDKTQPIESGKSISRKKSTNETTVKTTTNRSANSTAKGQSTDVLKGLNELVHSGLSKRPSTDLSPSSWLIDLSWFSQ